MTNSLIIYDIVAVTGAYFLALLLRFDFRYTYIPQVYYETWLKFAPFYAAFCIADGRKISIKILLFDAFEVAKPRFSRKNSGN